MGADVIAQKVGCSPCGFQEKWMSKSQREWEQQTFQSNESMHNVEHQSHFYVSYFMNSDSMLLLDDCW